jgi:hypothetical protein
MPIELVALFGMNQTSKACGIAAWTKEFWR